MKTLPMHPVDAAWLHMDGVANTAVVTVLLTARRRFDAQAVRRQLEQRLATLPPFRRAVVDRDQWTGAPSWVELPTFDIAQHVHHRALPADAGTRGLRELVDDLASQPLPVGMPLWQAHVIDGPGAAGALVFRYHHCLGDGIAMVAVARRVFDGEDTLAPVPSSTPTPEDPASMLKVAWRLARQSLEGAATLVRDLAEPDDPTSPFKGASSARQRVAWSRAMPLARFRAIAHAFDAKVNDVAVAAIAGALRMHVPALREPGATLRAMVPVNLRTPGGDDDAGNQFGLAMLALPVELADPATRLRESARRMAAIKRSPEAVAMHLLFDLFGRGPKALQQVAQGLFEDKVSLVLTNVPGPRRPLRLAGRVIDRLVFWVPHPGEGVGLGLSVNSYRERVTIGVVVDAAKLAEPERMVRRIERELTALDRAAAAAPPRVRAA